MTMSEYETHIRLLRADLQQVRRRADIAATGATLHRLRNRTACAQSVLMIADDLLRDKNTVALDVLLGLAQDALRDARAIIKRTRDPLLVPQVVSSQAWA
jgi:hypothetical protein